MELLLGHLLGGSTDTGSTDTQGPRDGNAGKKSSRSRMWGLLDGRKAVFPEAPWPLPEPTDMRAQGRQPAEEAGGLNGIGLAVGA